MAQRSSTRESKAERDTNGVDWFHLVMFPSTMSFDGSRNETITLFEGKYLFSRFTMGYKFSDCSYKTH